MAEIIRNRTIKPSTRLEKSKSYKIDTKAVSRGDALIVNIDHETKSFQKTYKFHGSELAHKKSISFQVNDLGTKIAISWGGATPIGTITSKSRTSTTPKPLTIKVVEKVVSNPVSTHYKNSFDPIADTETNILILGTMPGEKSLELGEYYGHSKNRFWKVIATITGNVLPVTYQGKKTLLLRSKIGVWDVREGSIDSAIKNAEPNDLDRFILKHKNLKVIGFNGLKSEVLFDKYFDQKNGIKYISLPSTSPANTGIDFDNTCKAWRQILTSLRRIG